MGPFTKNNGVFNDIFLNDFFGDFEFFYKRFSRKDCRIIKLCALWRIIDLVMNHTPPIQISGSKINCSVILMFIWINSRTLSEALNSSPLYNCFILFPLPKKVNWRIKNTHR